MLKVPNASEIFFVCTEGLVTSVTGAEALKLELVAAELPDVSVRHIQTSWLPKDAKIVLCHKNTVGFVQGLVPEAVVIGVTDFLKAPEYKELAEALKEARGL